MENFMRVRKIWCVVESSIQHAPEGGILTEAQRAELAKRKLNDLKTKHYLFKAIDRPTLEIIICKRYFQGYMGLHKEEVYGLE